METTTRVPRPLGTTFLASNYNQNPSDELKDVLKRHIINNYIMMGFNLNGKSYSLPEISNLLRIPLSETMDIFTEISHGLGRLLSPEKIEDTLRGAMTLTLQWALQDKGRIDHQVSILAKSQGDSYKPFISSEVNKALKSSLDANKNIMEYFKALTTANQTTINIFNQSNTKSKDQFISPHQALELITKSGSYIPLQQNKEELQQLYQDNNLDDIPDLTQENVSNTVNSTLANNTELQEELNRDSKALGKNSNDILGISTPEPSSSEALQLQRLQAFPKVPKMALKPIKKGTHNDFFERRGYPITDTDILP